MRTYPVPFSTKGEDRLLFNLTLRELAWLLAGLAAGLGASSLLAAATNKFMLFCLPAALPFVGVAWLLATWKVKEVDHREVLDRHLFNAVLYRYRPHDYINYRR